MNFAATRLVNPPGTTTVLKQAQVWKGLCLKVREPQSFNSNVSSCTVINEFGNKITRALTIGNGPAVKEEVELDEPTICYFDSQTAETRIVNIISYNERDELLLTFSFVGGIPGYLQAPQENSIQELNMSVGNSVQTTIDRIRELVEEGAVEVMT